MPELDDPHLTGGRVAIRIVRLGSPRHPAEGTRLGTVRRPPRGVPKTQFATGDWFDVWYPNLAPSAEVMQLGQQATTVKAWAQFTKRYRAEMNAPDASRTLDVLAALSQDGDFSVGCYCEDEGHCHRGILRELLLARGARIVDE